MPSLTSIVLPTVVVLADVVTVGLVVVVAIEVVVAGRVEVVVDVGHVTIVVGVISVNGILLSDAYFAAAELMYPNIRSLGQFVNAYSPISVTDAGMVIDVNEVQLLNACVSIFVTVEGSSSDFRLSHPSKTSYPILSNFFGIFIEDSAEQP